MTGCHPDAEEPKLLQDLRKMADDLEDLKSSTKAYHDNLDYVLKRIEKLESNQLGQQLDPKVWVFVNERLDKLESITNKLDILNKVAPLLKSPFRCPVCDGCGESEDYSLKKMMCKSCKGFGIVWGQYE